MRLLRTLIAVALVVVGGSASAQGRLVVVELFTSQGCSSCPPADAILAELTERDDVLPLALHVDYWDYIGWKDSYGSPAFTRRQRDYARVAGDRTIYTPQMIVGGLEHVIGTKPMRLAELIQRHGRRANSVALDVHRSGQRLEIAARALRPEPGRYSVLVVAYRPSETVAIRRGENAGKTITYHNIVLDLSEVGRWNGQGSYNTTATVPATDEVAVLIQGEGHGPILAAARAE